MLKLEMGKIDKDLLNTEYITLILESPQQRKYDKCRNVGPCPSVCSVQE